MTEEERHAAAMADPDARPMTEEDIARRRADCPDGSAPCGER